MKGKLIGAGILLPVCGAGSVFLSSVFSLIMTKSWEGSHQLAWGMCLERLKADKQTAMIALVCFLMVYMVAVMLIFVMGSDKTTYKSELRDITDKISTPVPYGEKQHGSAQWLKKSEYPKEYSTALLDTRKGILPELIKTGKDDLAFLKPEKEDETPIEENAQGTEKEASEQGHSATKNRTNEPPA
jgi:hypothetical protein